MAQELLITPVALHEYRQPEFRCFWESFHLARSVSLTCTAIPSRERANDRTRIIFRLSEKDALRTELIGRRHIRYGRHMEFPEDERLYRKPNWEPLEKVVGRLNLSAFMYMGWVRCGEKTIFLYKHIVTRRYLNLDEQAQPYAYRAGSYLPIDLERALTYAFRSHGFYPPQNRYKGDIDIVELSALHAFPNKVALYFAVLESEIDLWSVASICESGNTDQLRVFTEKGRVCVFQNPDFIPGFPPTLAEVLRFEEAYFVKPDLRDLILGRRNTPRGGLVLRIHRKSLSAFLKPGLDAVYIPGSADLDLSIEVLLRGKSSAAECLIASESGQITRDVRSKYGREKLIDLVMISQGILLQEVISHHES